MAGTSSFLVGPLGVAGVPGEGARAGPHRRSASAWKSRGEPRAPCGPVGAPWAGSLRRAVRALPSGGPGQSCAQDRRPPPGGPVLQRNLGPRCGSACPRLWPESPVPPGVTWPPPAATALSAPPPAQRQGGSGRENPSRSLCETSFLQRTSLRNLNKQQSVPQLTRKALSDFASALDGICFG